MVTVRYQLVITWLYQFAFLHWRVQNQNQKSSEDFLQTTLPDLPETPLLCLLVVLTVSPGVPSHAQSLAALQAYAHWLAQFYSEVHRQNPEQFISLVSTALEAITPLISSKVLPPWGLGAALCSAGVGSVSQSHRKCPSSTGGQANTSISNLEAFKLSLMILWLESRVVCLSLSYGIKGTQLCSAGQIYRRIV